MVETVLYIGVLVPAWGLCRFQNGGRYSTFTSIVFSDTKCS